MQALHQSGQRCSGLIIDSEKIDARWTVIAAGCHSAEIEGAANYAPVRPAKGQMLGLRAKNFSVQRVLWADSVYLVPRNDGRVLAGATVEYVGFDKQVNAAGMQKYWRVHCRLRLRSTDAQKVEDTWAGLRPDSARPHANHRSCGLEGLLIAGGHFRSGILLAPITARLIREWITLQSVQRRIGRASARCDSSKTGKATNS